MIAGDQIAIAKSLISPLHECVGKVDKDSGRLFLGFRGARGDDGKYHGQVWFDDSEPPEDAETFSLSSVIEPSKSQRRRTKIQEEVSDG